MESESKLLVVISFLSVVVEFEKERTRRGDSGSCHLDNFNQSSVRDSDEND